MGSQRVGHDWATGLNWTEPSNQLILCHPLLLLPSIFPIIRVFSKESILCIRWPKYWTFSFSISPSNEYSGLISFRIDWFYLLTVQGTLKSLLQHHSSILGIRKCLHQNMVHTVRNQWRTYRSETYYSTCVGITRSQVASPRNRKAGYRKWPWHWHPLKGRERNWNEQDSSCDAVSAETSSSPFGASEVLIHFRNCPALSLESQTFISSSQRVVRSGFSAHPTAKGACLWVMLCFSVLAVSEEG